MRGIHLTLMALIALTPAAARTEVIYSSIPTTLPTNLPSIGYEATGTAEFGDAVGLAGTSRMLTSATVASATGLWKAPTRPSVIRRDIPCR